MARQDDRFVAKAPQPRDRPVDFVHIDGGVRRWGLDSNACPDGACHNVEGVTRLLSAAADIHLLDLHERWELVRCSGWEEMAAEHVPYVQCLPNARPFLPPRRDPRRGHRHRRHAAISAGAVTAPPR